MTDFQNKGLFVNLDQPNQVEFNRRKNVEQDQRLSTLSSQIQQLIEQAPSGFLPRVYYGLTRGGQTYRFTANAEITVTIPEEAANIGDAFEFYSSNEEQEYIPAIGILKDYSTIQIVIQGDYDIGEQTFTLENMRTGQSEELELLESPLTQQDASYLGSYPAADYPEKQIVVLNDLREARECIIVGCSNDCLLDAVTEAC